MTIRGLPDTAPEPEPNPSSEPEPRFQYQAPDPSIFFDLDAGSSTDSSSSSLESNNNNQYNHGEDAMGGSNSKVTTPSDFRYAATSPDVFKFPNIRPKLEKQDNGPEFGQRYRKENGNEDAVFTRIHTPVRPEVIKDCVICVERKPLDDFPVFSVSSACEHPPQACLACVETSIKTNFENRNWNQIQCPECNARMDFEDVERYADRETFAKYHVLAFRGAVNEAPDFVWCPNGCDSGQIHEAGNAQPIVRCVKCSFKFCFKHQVEWHEQLSCDEYDAFRRDPENFRSRIDIENEEAEQQRAAEQAARRLQEEADRRFAQTLLEDEQREEARRQARRERAEQEEREEAERRRREAERLARQQKDSRMRKEAARKKTEEDLSRKTVQKTTKPCPGCGWAIEKNMGCSHMTCTMCESEWCYECGADQKVIFQKGNDHHKAGCPWHSDNLPSN